MSYPEFGKITFIKRPVTRLITKPGNKVHVKFNIQTKPRYSVTSYWDSCTSDCCCNNKSNTWFGIGALIGAIGGIFAKIFGGKKQAQQTVPADDTRRQYVPPKDTPPVNPSNTDKGKEVPEVEEDPKVKEEPEIKPKVERKTSAGRSPAGWYRASTDGQSGVNGITEEKLKEAEAAGKSAANYVMEQVLSTKFTGDAALNENQKAKLLNEIIKKNPSVFDGHGNLKENADISKLDIPSKAWIENDGYNGIKGVTIIKKGENGINDVNIEKEVNQKTIRGNNGYYAVITTDPKTGTKSAKFYAPSDNAEVYNIDTGNMEKNNGRDITGPSFENHCPNIYKQVMAELAKANGTN